MTVSVLGRSLETCVCTWVCPLPRESWGWAVCRGMSVPVGSRVYTSVHVRVCGHACSWGYSQQPPPCFTPQLIKAFPLF